METFTLSRKELQRPGLIKAACSGRITTRQAAQALHLVNEAVGQIIAIRQPALMRDRLGCLHGELEIRRDACGPTLVGSSSMRPVEAAVDFHRIEAASIAFKMRAFARKLRSVLRWDSPSSGSDPAYSNCHGRVNDSPRSKVPDRSLLVRLHAY